MPYEVFFPKVFNLYLGNSASEPGWASDKPALYKREQFFCTCTPPASRIPVSSSIFFMPPIYEFMLLL